MNGETSSVPSYLYGGITGVKLSVERFDLGDGVELRKTYSHLFSANMMAFARPSVGGHHPAPWKAAKGGYGHDIEIELRAPHRTSLGENFDAKETIWWIATLIRLAYFPHLAVPVISNHSFCDIPSLQGEPMLEPFETSRNLFSETESHNLLDADRLGWVASKWIPVGRLLQTNRKFYTALKSLDSMTKQMSTSAALLALWGGLEQLFAPSTGELRFRVAALLASYLQEPGAARLELYKQILKLYNERSVAAHTAQTVETGPLIQTYVIMRNALIQMIDQTKIPTQADLEAMLFCVASYSTNSKQTTIS